MAIEAVDSMKSSPQENPLCLTRIVKLRSYSCSGDGMEILIFRAVKANCLPQIIVSSRKGVLSAVFSIVLLGHLGSTKMGDFPEEKMWNNSERPFKAFEFF